MQELFLLQASHMLWPSHAVSAVPVMERLEKLYSYASNGSLCSCLSLFRSVSCFSAVIIMAEVDRGATALLVDAGDYRANSVSPL